MEAYRVIYLEQAIKETFMIDEIRIKKLFDQLFPINRSIVGSAIQQSHRIIESYIGREANFIRIPSGTNINSWIIPQAWSISRSWGVCKKTGKLLFDTNVSNLHVWSHSIKFSGELTKSELVSRHVSVHPTIKNAIPYVTAYYSNTWGISLTREKLDEMCEGPFEINIHSKLQDGELEIMEFLLPGKSNQEILFTTYMCHPSMANNELTGPVLAAELIKLLVAKKETNYSYRFVFAPETIGHISYINQLGLEKLKNVIHGFNLTCLGIGQEWNIMPTRNGATYTDFVIELLLKSNGKDYQIRNFMERGSDERQYNSPNVDVDMVSAMRCKYHEFENYHTNLDNLDNLDFETFIDSVDTYSKLIELLEIDGNVISNFMGEPFLNSNPLLSTTGGQNHHNPSFRQDVLNFLAFCDGKSVLEIMQRTNLPYDEIFQLVDFLKIYKLARFSPFGSAS